MSTNFNDGEPEIATIAVAPAPVVIANQWQAAILGAIVTLVFAVQTAMTGGFSQVEAWNFLALAAGVVVTYIAPILASKWASFLKIGGAVLAAVAIAIVAVVDTANGGAGWNAETTVGVVFAGLNALAAAVGVGQRVAEVKAALADPAVDNAQVVAADPKGVQAAVAQTPAVSVPGLAD